MKRFTLRAISIVVLFFVILNTVALLPLGEPNAYLCFIDHPFGTTTEPGWHLVDVERGTIIHYYLRTDPAIAHDIVPAPDLKSVGLSDTTTSGESILRILNLGNLVDTGSESVTSIETYERQVHLKTWSSDSGSFLFDVVESLSQNQTSEDGLPTGLYKFDLATQTTLHLLEDPVRRIPLWSPDETQLVYSKDGLFHIVDLTTQESQPWRSSVRPIVWSPDGTTIAYQLVDASIARQDLQLYNTQTEEIHTVPIDISIVNAFWVDSSTMYLYDRNALYRVNPQTGESEAVYDFRKHLGWCANLVRWSGRE